MVMTSLFLRMVHMRRVWPHLAFLTLVLCFGGGISIYSEVLPLRDGPKEFQFPKQIETRDGKVYEVLKNRRGEMVLSTDHSPLYVYMGTPSGGARTTSSYKTLLKKQLSGTPAEVSPRGVVSSPTFGIMAPGTGSPEVKKPEIWPIVTNAVAIDIGKRAFDLVYEFFSENPASFQTLFSGLSQEKFDLIRALFLDKSLKINKDLIDQLGVSEGQTDFTVDISIDKLTYPYHTIRVIPEHISADLEDKALVFKEGQILLKGKIRKLAVDGKMDFLSRWWAGWSSLLYPLSHNQLEEGIIENIGIEVALQPQIQDRVLQLKMAGGLKLTFADPVFKMRYHEIQANPVKKSESKDQWVQISDKTASEVAGGLEKLIAGALALKVDLEDELPPPALGGTFSGRLRYRVDFSEIRLYEEGIRLLLNMRVGAVPSDTCQFPVKDEVPPFFGSREDASRMPFNGNSMISGVLSESLINLTLHEAWRGCMFEIPRQPVTLLFRALSEKFSQENKQGKSERSLDVGDMGLDVRFKAPPRAVMDDVTMDAYLSSRGVKRETGGRDAYLFVPELSLEGFERDYEDVGESFSRRFGMKSELLFHFRVGSFEKGGSKYFVPGFERVLITKLVMEFWENGFQDEAVKLMEGDRERWEALLSNAISGAIEKRFNAYVEGVELNSLVYSHAKANLFLEDFGKKNHFFAFDMSVQKNANGVVNPNDGVRKIKELIGMVGESVKDDIPPGPIEIQDAPSSVVTHKALVLRFRCQDNVDSEDDIYFSYKLNEGSWSVFKKEPVALLYFRESGVYRLKVKAMDNAFNIQQNPVEMSFEVKFPSLPPNPPPKKPEPLPESVEKMDSPQSQQRDFPGHSVDEPLMFGCVIYAATADSPTFSWLLLIPLAILLIGRKRLVL